MPFHICWDVDFRGRIGRTKRIARQIREIAPRFVELKIEGDRGISELSSIVTEIHKCHPKVEATVALSAMAVAAARWGYPVTFLWAIEGGKTFSRCIPRDAQAISFTADEETILLLPEVLEDFVESGAGELHLPNVNAIRGLSARGHIPVPRPEQIREVSERIARNPVPLKGKRLIVHDFFLCRSLRDAFPGEVDNRVEFSGCQGGARLAHIDWDGSVYPCDALPIRLGNLLETPFERIWRSPEREHVAQAIHTALADCASCAAYSGCFGGCRGLAYLASGSIVPGKATVSEEAAASSPKEK